MYILAEVCSLNCTDFWPEAQFRPQSSCTEETFKSHTNWRCSVPFPDDPEDEASWLKTKQLWLPGLLVENNVHIQEMPKLKLWAVHEQTCVEPHPPRARGKILAFSQLTWTPKRAAAPACSPALHSREVYRHFLKAWGTA